MPIASRTVSEVRFMFETLLFFFTTGIYSILRLFDAALLDPGVRTWCSSGRSDRQIPEIIRRASALYLSTSAANLG
jgi:hypothetical protein